MASVVLEDGAVDVFVDWEPGPPQPSFAELYWSFDEPDWRVVVPDAEVIPRRIWLSIPLWLLAFICLAWPVTSFIIARRRHKRGFPVSVAPLPLGEVPSEVASGDRDEAERASARTS